MTKTTAAAAMMATASPPRTPSAAGRRLAGGSIEVGNDHLVIRLPAPRLLRLVARSVLLAAVMLSFPWLRDAFLPSGSPAAASAGVRIPAEAQPAASSSSSLSRWVDDPLVLPMLIADLKRQGLLGSNAGHRSVFLGDPGFWVAFLRRHGLEPVPERRAPAVADRSVDFVLVADVSAAEAALGFIDRVLKVGGVTAIRLSSDPSHAFHLPANYRMVYIRRFGSTFVATKKIAPAVEEPAAATAKSSRRRLLSVPETKKEALDGLEDALLEPPLKRGSTKKQLWRRTRYLPELTGDSLQAYPRRVFVDVVPGGGAGSMKWFEEHYPKRNSDFELITVRVRQGKSPSTSATEETAAAESGGVVEWLRRNVREEQYVVMKAEAEVAEEMVKGKAIGLVDELFLECKNQWQKGRRSKRAYWECLALYGKLKDQGVAVHQWWG